MRRQLRDGPGECDENISPVSSNQRTDTEEATGMFNGTPRPLVFPTTFKNTTVHIFLLNLKLCGSLRRV